MNAPLRLKFSVVPSTKPAGVLIETGHLTLALVWWRLSVSITAYEIVASGASGNGNLNCSQNTTTRWAVSNEAAWRTKEKLPVTDQAACGSLNEKEVNHFINR